MHAVQKDEPPDVAVEGVRFVVAVVTIRVDRSLVDLLVGLFGRYN
jgi:hypothetical protein